MSGSRLLDNRLYVDNKRFTVLGGEIHNSSSSTVDAIRRSFALTCEAGANTVLAPIAWERVEPTEGEFDFTLVDWMVETAREMGLKLIPLWFGSWKNGKSNYAPGWVKTNSARFPRAAVRSAQSASTHALPANALSPFCREAAECDARAFTAVMHRIAETDPDGTVIMVQVENEVGLLGDSRDRSRLAEQAWRGAIPERMIASIRDASDLAVKDHWVARGSLAEGSWSEVLGESPEAEEAFMAWAYAEYVEYIASSGRKALDVPLLVNAWQDVEIDVPLSSGNEVPALAVAGGQQPGTYPSGGPVIRVAEIWRHFAPTIDLLCPDIYFGDFTAISRGYARLGGGLFIPEMRRGADGVASMFAAIAELDAVGVAPFGIDSIDLESAEAATLKDGYRLLGAIAEASAAGSPKTGFALDERTPSQQRRMGDYLIEATAAGVMGIAPPAYPAYGALVMETPDTFLVAGRGITLSFTGDDMAVAFLEVSELDHHGRVVRWRNGDEIGSGSDSALRVTELFPPNHGFPIPMWEECTGLFRVRLYTQGPSV